MGHQGIPWVHVGQPSLLADVGPRYFLVAGWVPHLTLGSLLYEMYPDSGWPGPVCVVCSPGDTRPSSICNVCNMATVR